MAPPSSPGDSGHPTASVPEPELSNPRVAEGINVSDKRPLRTFFVNLAITVVGLLALLAALDLAASFLTPHIPFGWEKSLVGGALFDKEPVGRDRERQNALRLLAGRVAGVMELPEGMDITVFYNPRGTVNAFATLGGNIVVYRGILERLDSEDALAMVLAHEIAHVKHRDAVRGLVRVLGLALLYTGLQESGAYVEKVLDVGMAGYSRSQEEAADAEAVRAIGRLYGHAGGAEAFFRSLARSEELDVDQEKKRDLTEIFASHPDTRLRYEKAKAVSEAIPVPFTGAMTPLPGTLAGIE